MSSKRSGSGIWFKQPSVIFSFLAFRRLGSPSFEASLATMLVNVTVADACRHGKEWLVAAFPAFFFPSFLTDFLADNTCSFFFYLPSPLPCALPTTSTRSESLKILVDSILKISCGTRWTHVSDWAWDAARLLLLRSARKTDLPTRRPLMDAIRLLSRVQTVP